jgi:hypothetical protein
MITEKDIIQKPPARNITFSIRMTSEEKRKLQKHAEKLGITLNKLIYCIIKKEL